MDANGKPTVEARFSKVALIVSGVVCFILILFFSSLIPFSRPVSSSPELHTPPQQKNTATKKMTSELSKLLQEKSPRHTSIPFVPFSNGTMALEILHLISDADEDFPKEDSDYNLSQLPLTDPPLVTNRGVHIITTFFRGTYSIARVGEVLSTIISNTENPNVQAVHVLWEVDNPLWYIPLHIMQGIPRFRQKLVLTAVDHQPTYKEMFVYANEKLQRGAIAIITNGDIYFDASVGCLQTHASNKGDDAKQEKRQALPLSRRHSPLCGKKLDKQDRWTKLFDICTHYIQAHDHFVFAPPVPQSMLDFVDHTQNVAYGAENVVIHEFRRAGFLLFNYCFTIKGFHHHCVTDRHSHPEKTVSKIRGNYRHDFQPSEGKDKRCDEIWVY